MKFIAVNHPGLNVDLNELPNGISLVNILSVGACVIKWDEIHLFPKERLTELFLELVKIS